jgi:hypothetical protein
MKVIEAHQKVLELLIQHSNNPINVPAGHMLWIFWIYDDSNPWAKDGNVISRSNVMVKVLKRHRLEDQIKGRSLIAAFIEDDIDADKFQLIKNSQATLRSLNVTTMIHFFVNYGNCKHEVVDNGTRVSECKHCRRRMVFIDWEWKEG